MSSLMHPVGPQPPSVYWVRRALVLVVLLALVLGLRWWLGRGDSAATGTPDPTISPTSAASPTAGASSPAASPTASGAGSPSASASATAAIKACTDEQITVTASTDAATYKVGSTPRLRMRIQNTSSTACRRDIGAAQNELVITSGSTRVWSSDDCNPGGEPQVVTLKPQQSYSVSVTWLGRLSQKGCPADQPLAQAGTYKLTGRNGDAVSAPAVFSLTAST